MTWHKYYVPESSKIKRRNIALLQYYIALFLSLTFCQNLLDGLLFLQQESSNDALFEASGAAAASVGPGYSSFPLFQIRVGGLFKVLDSRKGRFAVGTLGALGGLVDLASRQFATRGTRRADLVGLGVVRMASGACVAIVTHVGNIWSAEGICRGWREETCMSST